MECYAYVTLTGNRLSGRHLAGGRDYAGSDDEGG